MSTSGRHGECISDDPPNTVAAYRYNGLGYLIGEHADFNADSEVDGDDPWRWFVYDERWRVIASYRGTDEAVEADAKERFVYHAAGFRSSGSYIDDLILRDRDAVQPEADPANTDPAQTWLFESDGVLEERVFICQNWRADVALVVDSSGAAVQRAWYTAYGVPTGADRADLNGDGVVDSADASVFSAWHGASDVRADWNLDGTVNSTDTIAYLNAYNSAATLGGRGVLSSAALDLRTGYAGYRWDAFTERYHVRHRVYEPYLGVWQSRDPADYLFDINVYRYLTNNPVVDRDFTGLGPPWWDDYWRDFREGIKELRDYWLDPTPGVTIPTYSKVSFAVAGGCGELALKKATKGKSQNCVAFCCASWGTYRYFGGSTGYSRIDQAIDGIAIGAGTTSLCVRKGPGERPLLWELIHQ
ncbi:MAG: hypothetical protein KIS87_11660 [Phycisphaeraceae bacterium]|nr:hypothetical protein [Phycisphaeraceae bacterium]